MRRGGGYVREVIRRLDAARARWAQERRPLGGAKAKVRDFDREVGYGPDWWSAIRRGHRRSDAGLTLAQVEAMCAVLGVEPEEILGRQGPLAALRQLAGQGRRRRAVRQGEEPLDAAIRLRRQGDLAGAAAIVGELLQRSPDDGETWVRASYVLAAASRYQDAEAAGERALMTSLLAGQQRTCARALLAIAHARVLQGASEAALNCSAAALLFEGLAPVDLFSLHDLRAAALRTLSRFGEAKVELRESARYAVGPGQECFVWWRIGDVEAGEGADAAALAAYQRAYELAEKGAEQVPATDRAHLLALVGASAYRNRNLALARTLMPAAAALLRELAAAAPEAEAILTAAVRAATLEERAAAWSSAAAGLAALRNRGRQPPVSAPSC